MNNVVRVSLLNSKNPTSCIYVSSEINVAQRTRWDADLFFKLLLQGERVNGLSFSFNLKDSILNNMNSCNAILKWQSGLSIQSLLINNSVIHWLVQHNMILRWTWYICERNTFHQTAHTSASMSKIRSFLLEDNMEDFLRQCVCAQSEIAPYSCTS